MLDQGYTLRIVRSVFNLQPTAADLYPPGLHRSVESIPWWRIKRLLATGECVLNTRDLATATEIVVSPNRRTDGGRMN